MIRFTKKQIAIIAPVFVITLILCVALFLLNKTRLEYHTQLTRFNQTTKETLFKKSEGIQAAIKEGDSTKNREAIKEFRQAITDISNQLPGQPCFLSLQLVTKEDVATASDSQQALKKLADDLQRSEDLLEYGHAVSLILQQVVTKTGDNAQEQTTLAEAWGTAVDSLKTQSSPEQLAEVHQKLVAAAEGIHAQLAALPDLYTKKDITGFAAKQSEVENAITQLRLIGAEIRQVSGTQDKLIAADYQKVLSHLN